MENQPGIETTQQTQQTQVVETTTPTQTPAPQQTARDDVYDKYNRLYGQEGQQPQQQVETPPVQQPPVVQQTPDYANEIQALKAQIEALKTSTAPKPPEPQTPVKEETWVDLLRQGEFDRAEQVLINRVKAATTPDASAQAVAETLELVKIQNGVEQYLTKLRADNPDIVPMERYLRAPVEMRIETAKANNQIKNADDFLRIYREAVDAEVSEMRKISQQYRAAGKTEAQTVQRTILSATPLSPNGVSLNRETQPTEPQVESPNDYLARRMALQRAQRGLAS